MDQMNQLAHDGRGVPWGLYAHVGTVGMGDQVDGDDDDVLCASLYLSSTYIILCGIFFQLIRHWKIKLDDVLSNDII
uniref:Uncharacterized protein n=1 Tax=viral metagenome TaxID=1070528 RepID=A0A6C0BMF7_9ZZZZ